MRGCGYIRSYSSVPTVNGGSFSLDCIVIKTVIPTCLRGRGYSVLYMRWINALVRTDLVALHLIATQCIYVNCQLMQFGEKNISPANPGGDVSLFLPQINWSRSPSFRWENFRRKNHYLWLFITRDVRNKG